MKILYFNTKIDCEDCLYTALEKLSNYQKGRLLYKKSKIGYEIIIETNENVGAIETSVLKGDKSDFETAHAKMMNNKEYNKIKDDFTSYEGSIGDKKVEAHKIS